MQNAADASRTSPLPRRFLPVIVALALAAVVFPIEWLGVLYPQFGAALSGTFPGEFHHSVGHATLFAALGLLALWLFPALRARPLRSIGY